MEPAAETAPTDSHYAILHNRDFLLYLAARFIASIGQQMLTVAVGWELYERTDSALALGLVGLTQMAPMLLLTLPAGLSDDGIPVGFQLVGRAFEEATLCRAGLAYQEARNWRATPRLARSLRSPPS